MFYTAFVCVFWLVCQQLLLTFTHCFMFYIMFGTQRLRFVSCLINQRWSIDRRNNYWLDLHQRCIFGQEVSVKFWKSSGFRLQISDISILTGSALAEVCSCYSRLFWVLHSGLGRWIWPFCMPYNAVCRSSSSWQWWPMKWPPKSPSANTSRTSTSCGKLWWALKCILSNS